MTDRERKKLGFNFIPGMSSPETKETTNQIEQLRKFLDAFIWTDCSDEIYLKEDQKEKYQDFVRELHDDEFPNHWRYRNDSGFFFNEAI